MAIGPNLTKQRLARGDLVIGLGVRQFQSAEIGLIAVATGFDFLFIDREHSTMEMSRAGEICTAALGQGVTPIVRVPGPESHHCVPLFDCGVQGIVVPHIETADEARAMVEVQKFPPLGSRSMSRSSAMTGYETMAIADIATKANQEGMVIALLETAAAVENAASIAAVEHVDVLMIGASDLCADLGIAGKFDDSAAVAACTKIIEACKLHGKSCGIAGVRDDALLRHYIELGVRMVHAGTDAPMLVEACKAKTTALRQLWSSMKA